MTFAALALVLVVGLQDRTAAPDSPSETPGQEIADAETLARAEEVASELGRYLSAIERHFEAGEDPLSGEPGEAMFSDDACATVPVEEQDLSKFTWVAGAPGRPLVVDQKGEAPLVLDEGTGREDAIDQTRALFRDLERSLGGRPTRAAEIKAKEVLHAVGAGSDSGPDTWDLRFRVRHVRRVSGAEAVATKSIWKIRVTFDGPFLRVVAWAGAVVETLQLGSDPDSSGFVDVTTSVLTGERVKWLAQSIMELRDRFDVDVGVGILGHHGVAVADTNGDGIEDIYLCQPGGIPNQLWLRNADGTAVEAAGAGGLDIIDATTSALFVDLDGDLDRDVVLGLASGVVILTRTDEGYREAARFERIGITSLAAADVNSDGRIDIYACAYANPYDGSTFPVPYHDAENGQMNLMLANVTQRPDELLFGDATVESGLDVAGARFSFAATFEDIDDDGDVDLYVANDFGRNALYINDGDGHFENRSAALGVEDIAAGMGASFADIDGDGRVDLYVTNMESSAGRRVTGQEIFRTELDEETRALYRRHAKGNTLFLRDGDGGFRETGLASEGQWAWGAIPIDLDGNGALDLFVPNGFVTGTNAKAPDL